jgi:2'-5' RNA ligase
MKYLKLKTIEQFPPKQNESKPSHITFAFFGSVVVNQVVLNDIINKNNIKPFTLTKVRSDKFGENNDIPVVVYKITSDEYNLHLQRLRKKLLDETGVLDQNFENWTPHISNVNFDECPEIINVVGIESNEKTFDCVFL